jgi:hypothetical protein
MHDRFHEIRAAGIRVVVDLAVGHLRALEIKQDGRFLTPLYTAPWVDEPSIAEDEAILPNLRFLSGDFFCAPFGGADEQGTPTHGWPATRRGNTSKRLLTRAAARRTLRAWQTPARAHAS